MRNEQNWNVFGGERQVWGRTSAYENMQQQKEMWVLGLVGEEAEKAALGTCLKTK